MSLAKSFAFGVEGGQLGVELLLAEGDAGANLVQGDGLDFNLGAGCGERGLLGFSALQAGELLVFQAIGFGGFKGDFVLDGGGLLGGFHCIELRAEAGGFLAVAGDLAFQAGAQGLLAAECVRGFGGLVLRLGQYGLGLGDFGRQGARGEGYAGALQIHFLQLYEIFNVRLHLCYEVYGIQPAIKKMRVRLKSWRQ